MYNRVICALGHPYICIVIMDTSPGREN